MVLLHSPKRVLGALATLYVCYEVVLCVELLARTRAQHALNAVQLSSLRNSPGEPAAKHGYQCNWSAHTITCLTGALLGCKSWCLQHSFRVDWLN